MFYSDEFLSMHGLTINCSSISTVLHNSSVKICLPESDFQKTRESYPTFEKFLEFSREFEKVRESSRRFLNFPETSRILLKVLETFSIF